MQKWRGGGKIKGIFQKEMKRGRKERLEKRRRERKKGRHTRTGEGKKIKLLDE